LRVGPYEITVHLEGFADLARSLTVTVGSAFDLPVTLAVAGVTADVTVTGQATVLEAARSQIAGTVSQTEVQSLPMNGRNFLDLALLIPAYLRPTSAAPSCSPRRPRSRARVSPSAASATFRTTSSSTACRQTTTRLD
jgi:hypothetical protein